MNKNYAVKHLQTIRDSLGKKRRQVLHIAEYCQAENIERTLFETELTNALLPKHLQK